MSGSCSFEGCTVDQTGVCALEREPSTCSNRFSHENEASATGRGDGTTSEASQAPLDEPVRGSPLPSSRPLGLEDLNALMSKRYVNVVGILGDPESGKTACLASLYLLVSHAMLNGWSFADSKSLIAFEDIARGARDWNDGNAPEQMTVHTEMADDHAPGFLHLRLVRKADGRRFDMALPDIPGEWTQSFVNTARSDRLDFLKSAETVWVVLDGRTLSDIEKRQGLIARAGQLAARLQTLLGHGLRRVILVVTHRDQHVPDTQVAHRLQGEFNRRGHQSEIVCVAPFSDDPDKVPGGFGIAELIDKTLGRPQGRPVFWAHSEPAEGQRAYLSFRRDR